MLITAKPTIKFTQPHIYMQEAYIFYAALLLHKVRAPSLRGKCYDWRRIILSISVTTVMLIFASFGSIVGLASPAALKYARRNHLV